MGPNGRKRLKGTHLRNPGNLTFRNPQKKRGKNPGRRKENARRN